MRGSIPKTACLTLRLRCCVPKSKQIFCMKISNTVKRFRPRKLFSTTCGVVFPHLRRNPFKVFLGMRCRSNVRPRFFNWLRISIAPYCFWQKRRQCVGVRLALSQCIPKTYFSLVATTLPVCVFKELLESCGCFGLKITVGFRCGWSG